MGQRHSTLILVNIWSASSSLASPFVWVSRCFPLVQIHVVSAADTFLPLIVADAMRPDLTPEEEEKAEKEGKVGFLSPGVLAYSV